MNREQLLTMAKPILLNTEMVKAILDGRKTQTRRAIKFPRYIKDDGEKLILLEDGGGYSDDWTIQSLIANGYMSSKYQVGEILYVRETWCFISDWCDVDESVGVPDGYIYKTDFWESLEQPKWHPSIHMPKQAARIFLRVTDVRVERLQQITKEDVKNEGVYVETNNSGVMHKIMFAKLWDSTLTAPNKFMSSPYRWERNPWVFVYEFEKVKEELGEKKYLFGVGK